MTRWVKKRSRKAGLPPGTLVHIGEERIAGAKITVMDYDEDHLQEKQIQMIEEVFPLKDKPTATWINICGIHQVDIIEKIGTYYNIHPLNLEDIVNTGQRPKAEDFDEYLYIVLKMLHWEQNSQKVTAEQISLILGDNFLISFQESEGDVLEPVRDRIRKARGRIRRSGCDYLAYTIVDAIVDHYFLILEKLGERMEDLEEELMKDPTHQTVQCIHDMKSELIFLRKQIWPMREVLTLMTKGTSSLIKDSTLIYFSDVYDHTIQVIDTIETFRDMLGGMLDIYLSIVSNKMNEVMKLLTLIATLFIPLTFIAGIYGMNFKFMPELEWRPGYFAVWGVMIVIAILMLVYFKKKKWL